ncbi:MAG: glycosyl transferase family 1, partial [Prevotellaceae bacterium]|nr:glycosyl transferase family 1 [Prevotellaceae bacterium]
DCMLSMDSGNAHLAALTGTRVVTLWGPTHPHAGFSAFGQSPADNIQADLPCRPCSIYGNKPCRFGDLRCMKALSPEMVADVLLKILCK